MKSSGILVLVFGLLLFGMSSCEKELKVYSLDEEKMVLNGIVEVSQSIEVQISKTRDILDDKDSIDWIRNADVYLTCAGNSFEEKMQYVGKGIYTSEHIAKFSEEYELEIVHSVYTEVTAMATMPDSSLASVRYINADEENSFFELEIKNRKEGSYYIWEMIYQESNEIAPSVVSIVSLDQKTDNILPDESQDRNKIFMRGNQAEGERVNSNFVAEFLTDEEVDKTTVRLLTVNEDMYNYYKSLELYRNSLNNYLEPIDIYSNVSNGLGIFGAFSETIIEVQR